MKNIDWVNYLILLGVVFIISPFILFIIYVNAFLLSEILNLF